MQRFARTAVIASVAALIAGCVSDPYSNRLDSFVEGLRTRSHAPPGFVVVAVHRNRTVFEHAYGVRDVRSGAPLTLDTPVYNASVTKAYTGVLAAVLDDRGDLPLATSLLDVWPQLTLPEGLDPRAITVTQLLSHTSGLRAGGLLYRSVTTGEITAADVPLHLQRFATRSAPEFVYSNLGPFVYSAMIESRTGASWRDSLRRHVLEPMGLHHTSARLEDLAEVAHCHYWEGGAWHSAPSKPTAVLNAAGGLYASGRDTARFLQAFVRDDDGAGVSRAALRRTWQPFAEQNRDFLGMHRDSYGLGWDLGTYDGRRFVSRSGGYTGCRALILFLPAEQFGIAVLSGGDTGANDFNSAIVRQAIDYWVGSANAAQRATERTAEYERVATAEFARLPRRTTDSQPVAEDLARAMRGTYENERLGRLELTQENGALALHAGVWTGDLDSIGGTRFIATERGTNNTTAVTVVRNASGSVTAIVFDDDRFDRSTP